MNCPNIWGLARQRHIITWVHIKGFWPEWCISTTYHAWDTPFYSGTLDILLLWINSYTFPFSLLVFVITTTITFWGQEENRPGWHLEIKLMSLPHYISAETWSPGWDRISKTTTTIGGQNSSVGSAWVRWPQRRGFNPPLGTFSVEGIFPLELTWVQTPFPPKLLRMRV